MSNINFLGSMPMPIKVRHEDLKRLGIVRSRYDQHLKIKSGKLRPPNKTGGNMQSSAWWWGADIIEDLERERQATGQGEAA